MAKKSLQTFVKTYRTEINECIRANTPGIKHDSINDKQRADWVKKDEGLREWARENNVNV